MLERIICYMLDIIALKYSIGQKWFLRMPLKGAIPSAKYLSYSPRDLLRRKQQF